MLPNHFLLKKKSFTLIELLLVVAVLLVIAGIAIPKFTMINERIQFKESAENLAFTLRYAQNQAVTQNNDYRVEFDEEFKEYWLLVKTGGEEGQFVRVTGQMGKIFKIPEPITAEADQQAINFYPDGRIDKTRIYVCFNEDCKTVSTQEQSGYVFVIEYKI